jgi:hypothetical protein
VEWIQLAQGRGKRYELTGFIHGREDHNLINEQHLLK